MKIGKASCGLKNRLSFGVGSLALSAALFAWAEPAPIRFVALLNTNDPASLVATGALTGSNLDFTISVPPQMARVRIVCTSDGITPDGPTIWEIIGPRTIPGRPTNGIPPIPPIPHPRPTITNLPPPILVTNPPPILINPPPILISNPPPIFITNLPPILPPEPSITPLALLQQSALPGSDADSPTGQGPGPLFPPPGGVFPGPVYLPPVVTKRLELSKDEIARFLNGLCLVMFIDQAGAIVQTAHILPDSDDDGVPDSGDRCPDTLEGSLVNSHGCSIDQLAPCEASWRNHGHFLLRFKEVVADFLRAGLIDARTAGALQRAAAESDCGDQTEHHSNRGKH